MINIFYEEGNSIGFTFKLFSSMKFAVDQQDFESEIQKNNYLLESIRDSILFNLEYLVNTFQPDGEVEIVSVNRLKDYLKWSCENSDNISKILSSGLVMQKFMNTIENSNVCSSKIRALISSVKNDILKGTERIEQSNTYQKK